MSAAADGEQDGNTAAEVCAPMDVEETEDAGLPEAAGKPLAAGPPAADVDPGSSSAAAAPAAPPDVAMAGDDDDDDDPVVQELDVYLNRLHDPPEFVGDMYLLQYPLRPRYRPYGDHGVLDKVEIEQKSRQLRFTYNLNKEDNYSPDSDIEKHVLSSVTVANPACSYAVGVIHEGRLTLVPLRAVNQLRPDFDEHDKMKAKRGRPTDTDKDPNAEEGDEDGGANMGTSVSVEYQVARDGNAAPEPEEQLNWEVLDYYRSDSRESSGVYRDHLCKPAVEAAEFERLGQDPADPKLQALELNPDREVFLSALCSLSGPKSENKSNESVASLPKTMLSGMPAARAVGMIVRHLTVVSYTKQLKKLLPTSTLRQHNDEQLMELLKGCAVLVAGNWVLASEYQSSWEGDLKLVRDMYLGMMNKSNGEMKLTEYEKWIATFVGRFKMRREQLESIARGVSKKERVGAGEGDFVIKLKNPPDKDFFKRFPQVVEEWKETWKVKTDELVNQIRGSKSTNKDVGKSSQVSRANQRRAWLQDQVQHLLSSRCAISLDELRKEIQRKHTAEEIKEEQLVLILNSEELGAAKVRSLYVLAKKGTAAQEKYFEVLLSLFKEKDMVTKEDIDEAYRTMHGEDCKLSAYQQSTLIRDIADRIPGVEAGSFLYRFKGAAGS